MSTLNIAYLLDRPLPANQTDSEQAIQTIAALARRGHAVTLVLPGNAGKPGPDVEHIAKHYEVESSFSVSYVPNRWLDFEHGRKLSHARRAPRAAAVARADLVYTRNFPTLFQLARLPPSAPPFVYETYRPWMDQFPGLRRRFRRALAPARCLGLVLHSHYAAERYTALGLEADKILVAHNGHDPAWFAEPLTQQQARERLGLPRERPIAVYAGHVNLTKGLDTVFRMAERCPDILFLFVGASGRGLTEWLGRRRRNVQFITWRPFREVKDYLYAADVLLQPPSLIPLRLVRNTILPMKLFLYLAAGRPVLAPRADDTRELLRHGENAWLVEAGQLDAAVEGIRRLVRDPALARQLSLGALASAHGLTWDARAEKLERFIGARLANYRTGLASRLT